ncbi:MAG TPA: N-acetylmuramoyl-L-alanine amidase [Alphaproteobacteria bacterium]|nr:N-acetylmuramoyl-L-alanine amidase [Alphaproteobacteria bacterium]
MRVGRLPWLGWLAGFAVLLASPAEGAELTATAVHVSVEPAHTRFMVDFSDTTTFQVFTLRDPYRVVVDLPPINWKVGASATREHGGVIDGYRFGLFRPDTFRIVLDVNRPVAVESAVTTAAADGGMHRLVLDLSSISKAEFDRTYVGPPQPNETAAVRPSPPPPVGTLPRKDGKRIVVIDPGHGGVDPGTSGTSGVYEKDITLAAAKELKRQLEVSRHYRVVLTRDSDVFVPLRERVEVARAAHAQLFVSLHADSIASAGIQGSSVYTLSDKASDSEAAALATKENKADIIAGANLASYPSDVTDILIDLAQRETKNDSIKYAHFLVQELDKNGRLLGRSMRSAGFAVLKAPDVPSVLLEMGYLSNPKEEQQLRSPQYRAKLMAAVKQAIDDFFAEQERLTKS